MFNDNPEGNYDRIWILVLQQRKHFFVPSMDMFDSFSR